MTLLIQNCRLETGFNSVNQQVVSTKTETYDVLITNGIISDIAKAIPTTPDMTLINAQEALLLPALKEMHIHIDKTYFGGPWHACQPITNGIFTRFEEESTLLPNQLDTAYDRACKVLEHYIAQGHHHIRSHCNVDPYIGTKHIELTKRAFDTYRDYLTYEIVAFPQHGLLRSNVLPLMKEAMKMGASHVGGVDPSTVDRDVDHSLTTILDLAVEFDAGVDVHLHNRDSLGEYEFYKLADYTRQANKQNQVTISHGMALGDLSGEALTKMVDTLITTGIDVTTTVPINRPTMPIPQLVKDGLRVSLGHDSLTDHWSPFGTGNTIAKMNVLAQRFGLSDELRLSRIWQYGAGGLLPLDESGQQVWPYIGAPADAVLVSAESSAHAIARKREITHTITKGICAYEQSNRIDQGE